MKKVILLFALFLLFVYVEPVLGAVQSGDPAEMYRLLYEEEKGANSQLVNIIYTTLGVTVALVILFLGASFLFNSKLNKKELVNEISKLREETMEKLNDQLNVRINKIDKQLKVETNSDIKSIRSRLDTNKKEQFYIKSEIQDLEGRHWENRGVYINVVNCYTKAIEYRINSEILAISHLIDKLIVALEKCDKIDASQNQQIYKVLDMIGEDYKAKKKRIADLLDEK